MAARKADLELLEQTEQLELPMEGGSDPLANFVETADRGRPWFFEGRTQERASVARRCRNALDEFRKGKPQNTVQGGVIVVQGPPGAGKTSLVTAVRGMKWRGGRPVAAVEVNAREVCDESKLVAAIMEQLSEAGKDEARSILERNPEGSLGALGIRPLAAAAAATLALAGHLPDGPLPATMSGFVEFLKKGGKTAKDLLRRLSGEGGFLNGEITELDHIRRIPDEAWNAPVLILIDEFQEIRDHVRNSSLLRTPSEQAAENKDAWDGERLESAKGTMQKLHRGILKRPVLTVCAGLSDTWNTLQDMGLTRTAESLEFNIDCLEPEEAVRVVRRMLDGCRIEGAAEQGQEWSELVADRTNGYPQHLHNGLVALGTLLEDRGRRLGDIDPEEWKDMEASVRQKMYVKRRSDEMTEAHAVVASAMHRLGERGLKTRDFNSALLKAAQDFDHENDVTKRWVPEMNVKWMRQHLLHQGAVQRMPDDTWKCGIRSFREWLSMETHPLHQAVLMRDREWTRNFLEEGRDPLEACLDGRTAVDIAREEGNRNVLRMLEDAVGKERIRKAGKGHAFEVAERRSKAEGESTGRKVLPRIFAFFQRMLGCRSGSGKSHLETGQRPKT